MADSRGLHRRTQAEDFDGPNWPGVRRASFFGRMDESVMSGRKTGAVMVRLYNVSMPTMSRIVAAHRIGLA